MQISKIEAAKRQLEMAIEIYFTDGDSVSMHTLIGAANDVLRGIAKRRGIKSMKEEFWSMASPERKDAVADLLSRTQNFFKHGSRDPGAFLDFNPEETYIYIFDSCLVYEKLTGEVSPIMNAFLVWVRMTTPDYFKWTEESAKILDSFRRDPCFSEWSSNKEAYFKRAVV